MVIKYQKRGGFMKHIVNKMEKRTHLVMSQVMLPSQANVAGNVHGGEIMKFMDSAAAALSMKYSRSNTVTARVDELRFHSPIFVGAMVSCFATIAYVGKTSMEVVVTVDVEDLESELPPKKALSAYFTMVALDKRGNPKKVPYLNIETEEEQLLYDEGKRRHDEHKKKPQDNKKD